MHGGLHTAANGSTHAGRCRRRAAPGGWPHLLRPQRLRTRWVMFGSPFSGKATLAATITAPKQLQGLQIRLDSHRRDYQVSATSLSRAPLQGLPAGTYRPSARYEHRSSRWVACSTSEPVRVGPATKSLTVQVRCPALGTRTRPRHARATATGTVSSAAVLAPCVPSQLHVSARHGGGAMGSFYVPIRVTNHASRCALAPRKLSLMQLPEGRQPRALGTLRPAELTHNALRTLNLRRGAHALLLASFPDECVTRGQITYASLALRIEGHLYPIPRARLPREFLSCHGGLEDLAVQTLPHHSDTGSRSG